MPIATNDLAAAGARPPSRIAKQQGNSSPQWGTSWAISGAPGVGSYDTTLNGVTLDGSTTGAMARANPASGNAYIYSLEGWVANSTAPFCMVLDRLWHNGGITITSTSAQTITSPTWPSRCPTSATDDTPSTGGHGVFLALETSSSVTSITQTVSVSYTNSAGTAGRTATNVQAISVAYGGGSFIPIGLQAGDVGVQSVQSLTLASSWISGTINLVAYRIVGTLAFPGNQPGRLDWYGAGSQRVYDNSCLFLASYIATNHYPVMTITETHG